MIDELARAAAPEPWSHERIPPGFDAKRVYQHAIAVGNSRRRRRRRGYVVGLAVLTVVVALSAMRELAPTPAARLRPVARKAEATADRSTLAALKAKRATTGAGQHQILALGDSVMVGASTALEAEIPSLSVDAKISRQIADAGYVLQQYKSAGILPSTVVIGLASNGTFTDAQFEQMMRVLGHRHAIFLNAFMPRPWESEVNRQLASNVKKYRNARLLDWHRIGRAHPGWFVSDGTHLNPTGVNAYSALIRVSALAPCEATKDATKAAAARFFAKARGRFPALLTDLTTGTRRLLIPPRGVTATAKTLTGDGWTLTMTGGGVNAPTLTCEVT